MFTTRSQLKSDLSTIICIVATLIVIGLLFIYSSSSVYALEKTGSSHYYLKRQMIGLGVGMLGFFIARFISLQFVYAMTPLFFWITWALTALTMIPKFAHTIHGSSRWLNIGGFSFQPSELLKIAFILYVARFLAKKEKKQFTFTGSYLPFLVMLGLVSVVLLNQPDFGMTVTLAVTSLTMLFIAQLPLTHLLLTFLACVPMVSLLIYTQPYRLRRIMTFLNPWDDPQGAGFQIIQSLIAIGSGSWWGSGISHSKQKFFYLPMQHTDFIFSIIAEETGFIGSCIILSLYLLLLYFGMKVAWQLKKTFPIYATLGLVILLSLQALINIFVATGLLPTKGIGLPFISYGNSSLVCSLAMIGLIANMVDDSL
ncbi:MAG: cell division protein FtsW [Alteromonas naphthalenivorans]|jgi:cell division protein FtsW